MAERQASKLGLLLLLLVFCLDVCDFALALAFFIGYSGYVLLVLLNHISSSSLVGCNRLFHDLILRV